MVDGDGFLSLDIGDGPGELDGAVDDSRRQDQFPGCFCEKIFAGLIERDEVVDMFWCDLRVGCDGKSEKSFLLDLPGIDDFFPDGRGILFRDVVEDLFDLLARNLQNHVDPVQQRAGNLALIALDVQQGTAAWLLRILVISADARIHRCDEHEIRGILDGSWHPGNHDILVFQRLAEHFKDLTRKLRQLVEKQDSLVRETDLSRRETRSSARDGNLGSGMVNLAERSLGDQGKIFGKLPDDGIDLTDFEDLFKSQRRQNARQGFAQQGFSAARRADQQEIVESCSCDR